MSMSLGIDVIGTHTDAMLLDARQRIIAYTRHTKQPTHVNVMRGIGQVLAALLFLAKVDRGDICQRYSAQPIAPMLSLSVNFYSQWHISAWRTGLAGGAAVK